ncbi:3-deoxy-D-manno-octulosonic-acid transferase [Halpernia humi]|uniref:3-deoxy-D-manno-octulosonic acid transferase n=1 Tax=Halpernia humi TaxID=493375 RepID=A0A1H5UR44_9FLAO|nr:glycosyltransferase N-terminal domain-containing protein [Halpernia humi]SEF76918.1 3-deoxy-D-manno-octulosonic-acid transferase [Halpernia humi]
MRFLYFIFIEFLITSMEVFSWFNEKAKKGILGRKQSCTIVEKAFKKTDEVIWMHAASLGEYEQGLPVLELLKKEFPEYKILVSFFSPSGYENVINKKNIADAIVYLPFDKKKWVKDFTSNFKTKIFFTVKYDYWYNLLEELKLQGAKTYVISALFYETQVFFKPYGKWFAKELKKNIDFFFHQTYHSTALAKSIGLENSVTTGDTRYDRVKEIAERDNFVANIEEFKSENKLIVFGSSWEKEEKIVEIILKKTENVKIILAPHDLKRIPEIQNQFPQANLYSDLKVSQISNLKSRILIIDSIGLLSKIYSYADLAVVGGGFHSAGLHNILEAATFGIPVFFGNHYKKNPEADDLIKNNGAKSFANEYEAADFLIKILEENPSETLAKMGENSKEFIHLQPNATQLIIEKILEEI